MFTICHSPRNKTKINVKCLDVTKTTFVKTFDAKQIMKVRSNVVGLDQNIWMFNSSQCQGSVQDSEYSVVSDICWDDPVMLWIILQLSPTAIKEAVKSLDNGSRGIEFQVLTQNFSFQTLEMKSSSFLLATQVPAHAMKQINVEINLAENCCIENETM